MIVLGICVSSLALCFTAAYFWFEHRISDLEEKVFDKKEK